MTRDEELDAIAAAVDRAGLGPHEVIPPQPGGADRWDVLFTMLPGVRARGIAFDGRSSFQNLLADIAAVGAARRATKIDISAWASTRTLRPRIVPPILATSS
jgi:hypothetical protein